MDLGELEIAANWISRANNVVAFTGAGISVESGETDVMLYDLSSLNSFRKMPEVGSRLAG